MKSVIFDLGNTVFRIDFNLCLEAWAKFAKKPVAAITAAYAFDDAYDAHEKNEITGAQYYEHVLRLFGARMTFQEFVDGWNAIYLDIIPETAAFVQKYADQTKILGLTNSNEIHRAFWEKKYASILSEFNKVYCSSQIGARKPAAEAYERVLQDAGLRPEDAVFVDDIEENIVGAEKVGIQSVHFTNPANDIARLQTLI